MKSKTLFSWVLGALILSVFPGTVAAGEVPEGLVLWNKLDSRAEVVAGSYGPGFAIVEDQGVVQFIGGMFGGAVGTTGGTAHTGPAGGYLSMNPDLFFGPDKTKGAVEFWVQKVVRKFTPYRSPLLTFFGRQRYATGYLSIQSGWNDDTPNSLSIGVYGGDWKSALFKGWEAIPVGQWVHVAMVWDGAGIEAGPDDVRIYLDGQVVANHQGRFSEVPPLCCIGYPCDSAPGGPYCAMGGYDVRVMANHEGRRLGYPAAYMDNLKVWAYAKTDFSDRFVEGFLLPPVADAGPDAALILGESALLDGSASHSPNGYLRTYEWTLDGAPLSYEPVFQHLFTAPGVYLITLEVTDEWGKSATDEVVVTVETLAQATVDLLATVEALETIPSGGSLSAQLEGIVTLLVDGKTKPAAGRLDAFIHHVSAQSGKKLSAADAALLIEAATRIRSTLD